MVDALLFLYWLAEHVRYIYADDSELFTRSTCDLKHSV